MGYNVHWGTIAAGATIPVCYIINGGQDFGAQFAEGSAENPGGDLVSDAHQKALTNDGAVTIYCFQLKNWGLTTNFKLEGGGLT